jgi:hypothetical protein
MSNLRVDSRWWYWVAAIPLVTAFWALSSLWVFVVVVVVPEAAVSGTRDVLTLPAVALGVPALVAFLVLPLALWLDARAIAAAGGDWPADPARAPTIAAVADAVVVGGTALFFEESALGLLGVLVGVALGTWVAVRYLRRRREHVEMPASFREWRRELRADDAVRR